MHAAVCYSQLFLLYLYIVEVEKEPFLGGEMGAHFVVLRAYSWFCTQGSILEVFRREPYSVLGMELRSDVCKANTLPAVLLL